MCYLYSLREVKEVNVGADDERVFDISVKQHMV